MTFLIKFVIRIYWNFMKPFHNKTCLFNTTCSNAVYNAANDKGAKYALSILKFRFNNCRNNFELFHSKETGEFSMKLGDGTIILQNEINPKLLTDHSKNIQT